MTGYLGGKELLGAVAMCINDNCAVCCRRHCNQEPDWSTPAIFLDEFDGAGWKLVSELLAGERSAQELLANEFVLTV